MRHLLATQTPSELTEELEAVTEHISRTQEYIDKYLPVAVSFGIRLVLAVIVFLIGTRVIKLLRRIFRRFMERANADTGVIQFLDSLMKVILYFLLIMLLASGFGVDTLLRRIFRRFMERANADTGVIQFLDSLMKVILYFLLIMLLASGFGVDTTSVMALVGSAGLTIGLAFQGSLSNFAGGVLILLIKPFKVGDYIIYVADGLEGTVAEIEMFYTTLLTPDNRKVVIPNGTLSNNSLINVTAQEKRRLDIDVGISYTADLKLTLLTPDNRKVVIPNGTLSNNSLINVTAQEKRRLDIDVGISYTADLKLARDLCEKLFEENEKILKEEEHVAVVDSLADSAVILKLRFWVKPEDYWAVKWKITEEVKLLFDAHGIEIPFNQLDVNIRK